MVEVEVKVAKQPSLVLTGIGLGLAKVGLAGIVVALTIMVAAETRSYAFPWAVLVISAMAGLTGVAFLAIAHIRRGHA